MTIRHTPSSSIPMRTIAHVGNNTTNMSELVDRIYAASGRECRNLIMRVTALALGREKRATDYLRRVLWWFVEKPDLTDDEILDKFAELFLTDPSL